MRLSTDSQVTLLFPECNFCKKVRIKQKGKVVVPTKIVTVNAEKTVKESEKTKDLELYSEIADVDLIAKEFQYYQVSYGDYLSSGKGANRVNYDKSRHSDEEEDSEKVKGNFEAVKKYIKDNILRVDSKAVCITKNV